MLRNRTSAGFPVWMMAAATFALVAGLLVGAHNALAQWANEIGFDEHHEEGPVCEPGVQNPQCGPAERCCVRVKEVQRVKVDGKWRTRVVLGGWRCFTGPNAKKMCRRYQR